MILHEIFTPKEIDTYTGLYYFNARWYDPNLGRFITEDPIKDGNNWYIYTLNNPLKYTDPTGLRNIIDNDANGSPVVENYTTEEVRSQNYEKEDFIDDGRINYTSSNYTKRTLSDKELSYALNNDIKPLQEESLKYAQETAMTNDVYKRGSSGPMNFIGANSSTTWCNQATYAISKRTGLSLDNFKKDSSDNINQINANKATQNLRYNASQENSSLRSINNETAKLLSDKGYTIIAASENFNGKGHIATLSTNQNYSGEGFPTVANIGWSNGYKDANTAFSNRDIEYYFDFSQAFGVTLDFSYEIGGRVE